MLLCGIVAINRASKQGRNNGSGEFLVFGRKLVYVCFGKSFPGFFFGGVCMFMYFGWFVKDPNLNAKVLIFITVIFRGSFVCFNFCVWLWGLLIFCHSTYHLWSMNDKQEILETGRGFPFDFCFYLQIACLKTEASIFIWCVLLLLPVFKCLLKCCLKKP